MNIIEKTLIDNIKDNNAIFVFPTQTAVQKWSDRILEIGNVSAIAMERFMAWDRFKGNSIKSQHQDKNSVPSTMRKIFAEQLLNHNKNEKFLKYIIPQEFASNSSIFSEHISTLIPSLALWKKYFDNSRASSNEEIDDEDSDLLFIYESYKQFLDKYNLFDPAWETPPFQKDGKHYFIFFPEILSDYIEYELILRSTEDITIINLPEPDNKKPAVKFFNNSRTEIKNIVSKLWEIKNDGKCNGWDEIVISVPNIETYGPYLDRELTINQIPHVMRKSAPLGSSGPGNLFQQIQECVTTDFTYDSVKDLLLNNHYPWKDKTAIDQLLEFGQTNHCICSFKYNDNQVNVWEQSFKENPKEDRAYTLFTMLKSSLTKISKSKSFDELRNNYFEFRSNFFDMAVCTKYADLILSRCISELSELIDLETIYQFQLDSPLRFFCQYIESVEYLPQTDSTGVEILPYKLAAAAPFGYQIIVDSSQRALSIVYEQLKFLKDLKRKKILKTQETNVSQFFIQLYEMNSIKGPVYFTSSLKTFDNYCQTCSYLEEEDLTKETDENKLYGNNFYSAEKNYIKKQESFPSKITKTQQTGFSNWAKQQNLNETSKETVCFEKNQEIINRKRPCLSTSQLKNFIHCPRYWLMKTSVGLDEENNTAELIGQYTTGNLYHKIFELYCKKLGEKNLLIHSEPDGLSEEYLLILDESITDAINFRDDRYYNSYLTRELMNTGYTTLKETMIKSVAYFSKVFDNCHVFKNEQQYFYSDPSKNYSCMGIVDCILKSDLKDDYYLVDFKSSSHGIPNSNMYAEPPADPNLVLPINQQDLPDFQMPMYIHLLRNDENSKITINNACFYDVTDASCELVFGENLAARLEINTEKLKIKNLKDFEPTISKLLECLDYFSELISTGNIATDPEVQNFSTCATCQYNQICRKTFNISRKS